jgi:hypothetical protein
MALSSEWVYIDQDFLFFEVISILIVSFGVEMFPVLYFFFLKKKVFNFLMFYKDLVS